MEIGVKNYQCYCKNKLTTTLHGLFSYQPYNEEMMSKCSKLCSETTCLHLVVPLEV